MRDQKAVFEEIYQKEKWGKGLGSGSGSDADYCAGWLTFLRKEIPDGSVVLDVGCGDHQMYRDFDLSRWDYHGCDISVTALGLAGEAGRTELERLHHVPDMSAILELAASVKPDFVIVKDVMMHWTDEEIEYFLDRLCVDFSGTIYTANSYRYFRTPDRPTLPRALDPKYSWAPLPADHPVLLRHGFRIAGYYARKRKEILVRPRRAN